MHLSISSIAKVLHPGRLMPVLVALASSALIVPTANAQDAKTLFAGANPVAGQAMHKEKNCSSCHIQRVGGNGDALYTRLERKVSSPAKLISQIAACNTQLNANLFPEDELDIAAYLNRDFYRFK